MVEQQNQIYLITGGKASQRQAAIDNLRKKIFEKDSSVFDLVILQAKDLNLNYFKELALTFSFQQKKILLIKDFTDLGRQIKSFLLENFSKILQISYLIFESETSYSLLKTKKKIFSDDFFNFVFKKSIKYEGKTKAGPITIDDFCKKLYQNDLKSCLSMAEEMLSSKNKEKIIATQILGAITAKVSRLTDLRKKKEALTYLWRTDRALKETNIDIRLLIERLLANLIQQN